MKTNFCVHLTKFINGYKFQRKSIFLFATKFWQKLCLWKSFAVENNKNGKYSYSWTEWGAYCFRWVLLNHFFLTKRLTNVENSSKLTLENIQLMYIVQWIIIIKLKPFWSNTNFCSIDQRKNTLQDSTEI